MTRRARLFGAIAAVALLAGGAVVFYLLVATRPRPEPRERGPRETAVETREVAPQRAVRVVTGFGTVRAARRVVLQPEVSGRVRWVSRALIPGGTVRRGEALVRLDDRELRLVLAARGADVARARLELELERGRKLQVPREREILDELAELRGRDPARVPVAGGLDALARREPQFEAARETLEAARSARERAQLDVERTVVRAPFDAVIQDESVDVGQLVSPQSTMAILVDRERAWVEASVPVEALAWIAIPGVHGVGTRGGAKVTIAQRAGGEASARRGRVIELVPALDPLGRTARLLVEVERPFEAREGEVPLLLDAHVRVDVEGRALERAFVLPGSAVDGEDRVHIMDPDGRLEVRTVEVLWRTEDEVVVGDGLAAGDRVVLSRIALPVPGMRLRSVSP